MPYENMESRVAKIPNTTEPEFTLVVATAKALNDHFDETAMHRHATGMRLHQLETEVRAMNKKLDKLLEQLSPQTTPKRDLRKPSAGGAS